ncbi:hypothetical protein ABEB36_000089 [Hypothenemus hampei]|uniref:Transposable element P transposase-like RNase H C-terminal domain-containing protein n=1 Tax=Hypothenemus hampei TaxID=57062 RepID=A0ABD1FAY2_HYPHA
MNSLLALYDDIKLHTPFICTRNLNQDCLENMFGNIRMQGGNSTNPSPAHFQNCFKKIFCLNYFKHIEGANCIDDLNQLLVKFDFSHVHELEAQTSTQPAIFNDLLNIPISTNFFFKMKKTIIHCYPQIT